MIDSDEFDEVTNCEITNEIALVDTSANEVAVIEKNFQLVEETTPIESIEQVQSVGEDLQTVENSVANAENQQIAANNSSENIMIETAETSELITANDAENEIQQPVVQVYDSSVQEIKSTETTVETGIENYVVEEEPSTVVGITDQEIETVENYTVENYIAEEAPIAARGIADNASARQSVETDEVVERVEETHNSAVFEEQERQFFDDGAYYYNNQGASVAQEPRYEDDYSNSFANRPLRNAAQDSSANFSSLFNNYSRENDVNYVESFSELFDVDDEEEIASPDDSAGIEYKSMKELVYQYQSKGINIKLFDKRNTMEYYVNRYYFSNKLQFHASLIIFAIFAFEFFVGHFICNRGANKVSDLWLLMIFALAIFPAVRSVMYVIDPTRKSLANYNAKTSFLISLLPVVTFPIVFALMGFVQFGANISDYESMEHSIILPSILLFNVPLFSIIYTLLYRTYKYQVN